MVNVAKAQGYLFANISVTMITMLINLLAAITILRKERTSVHLLIVNDCVVNVLSSLLTRVSQSDPRSESCNPFSSPKHTSNLSFFYTGKIFGK